MANDNSHSGIDLGTLFATYRKAHDITQGQLAARLTVDQSYISKIERNHRAIRDINFLKRVVDRLQVSPRSVGLTADDFLDESDVEVMRLAGSVIRLADTARTAGQPERAIRELHPLIIRLNAAVQRSPADRSLIHAAAEARTALGTCLGDVLPRERLNASVKELCAAADMAQRLGPSAPQSHIQRKLGNELRKFGSFEQASRVLERAIQSSHTSVDRGAALICLARLRAIEGKAREFHATLRKARLALDDSATELTPTFNPVSLNEVWLRGLSMLGQVREKDIQLATQDNAIGLAPQWAVIRECTIADVWLRTGDNQAAASHAKRAIEGAIRCKLPQQIERLQTSFVGHESPACQEVHALCVSASARLEPHSRVIWVG